MTPDQISMYGSYILMNYTGVGGISDRGITRVSNEFWDILRLKLQDRGSQVRGRNFITRLERDGAVRYVGYHFSESKLVSWCDTALNVRDELKCAVFIFVKGGYMAVACTESSHRDIIARALFDNKITNWAPIQQNLIIKAFIEGSKLKMLWLSGGHRSVSVRPDSKFISGQDLRDAIDPVGDSTFWASAARGDAFGISVNKSAIWIKSNPSWQNFRSQAEEVIDRLDGIAASAAQDQAIHRALAKKADGFYGADWEAYEIYIDCNLSGRDAEYARLLDFIDNYEFFVEDFSVIGQAGNNISAGDFLVAYRLNCSVANAYDYAHLRPGMVNGLVSYTVVQLFSPNGHDVSGIISVFDNYPECVRVYYGNGYSIVDRILIHTEVKDSSFDGWLWCDFNRGGVSYSVKDEKPDNNNFDLIWQSTAEDSLFSWVVRFGISDLGLRLPDANNRVWLYCDDGAMEVADFIHFDFFDPDSLQISLIHVKGAGSNSPRRNPIVGPYEVVVAQAIKNVNAVYSKELIGRLSQRFDSSRLWDAPWAHNVRPQGNVANLRQCLQNIRSNVNYKIVIVQPHALRTRYHSTGRLNSSIGSRQLRFLLHGLRQTINNVGAELVVVGDDR